MCQEPAPKMLIYFYSRPCGRGDVRSANARARFVRISTHAPAGGATVIVGKCAYCREFLLTPLREGRLMGLMI